MGHPLLIDKPGSTHLLLGNHAIVRGALEAGVTAVTCYPGTPSSEVPDTFFRLAPEAGVYFEYSVNEKVALEVGAGLSLSGALVLTTMKHVGVNVAADPLMTLAYTGAPGGLVLLSADDPNCHSSQNEQDNRIYGRLGGLPIFEPSTAQEAKDFTREALLFSRKHQMPVILRTTTRVNHMRGPVEFGPLPGPIKAEGFKKNPSRFVPVPAFARPLHTAQIENLESARAEAESCPLNTVSGEGKIGAVASGISRSYLCDALLNPELSGKIATLELGFTHPLPTKMAADFLRGKETVVVIEELEPVLENELRALAQKESIDVKIIGKDSPNLSRTGEYSRRNVEAALLEAVGLKQEPAENCAAPEGLPMRPPNLCAGCPHRASYYAVKQVFGDDAVYSSDIGCYTLGLLPPLSAADFLVCMGSSVSAGSGAAKAAGQTVVGFIGDSTFFHSGITGLVNAVFNNHDLLLVVLDNHTTAMTGHQPHPGVNVTAMGDNQHKVDLEQVIRGCGVNTVETVNPLNLKATQTALEKMKNMSGVRVLITREPCPLFARRIMRTTKPMTAYVAEPCAEVDEALASLACPAFYKEDGHTAVNELQCSGCMFCLQLSKKIKARKRSA